MHSCLKSLTATALLLPTLLSFGGCGVTVNSPWQYTQLPTLPGDYRVCFGNQVPAPIGTLDRTKTAELIKDLKLSDQAKTGCGERLICFYEDLSRNLDDPKKKTVISVDCAALGASATAPVTAPTKAWWEFW
jgi:hypothetical protein